MKSIFTKNLILLTVSLLGLANPTRKADSVCLDDQTFLYYTELGPVEVEGDQRELSCSDIGASQTLSDTLCVIEEVARSCPLSCSRCCKDNDASIVTFRKQNGVLGTCRWVSKRQKRIDRYCGTEVEYFTDQLFFEFSSVVLFDKLCPETCKVPWCPLPTSPPTFTTAPSPTITGSNFPTKSMVPSPVPTAYDFCLDDQTFLYYTELGPVEVGDQREFRCSDVGDSPNLVHELCGIEEVANSCPLSCALCCEDSKSNIIKFRRQNESLGTCRWVSKRKKRIDRYCGTEVEYTTAPAYQVPSEQLVLETGIVILFDKLCPETCKVSWCPNIYLPPQQ
ncbi:predicted protein [Chaetoceros tenuissimus]|uniref:SREBP regulating gene protein n=1 Tax=Chaetoceros tenuissimus TaxID=426638 RepID=A0AAD3D389_9STRA|nr:predicted protein [Chaetoceros tenuissimus]